MNYYYFNQASFKSISNLNLEFELEMKIKAAMLRINILSSIQIAGSGHLGTSFSALEIMLTSLNFLEKFKENNHFFSSKGHDAPALYACYESMGKLDDRSILKLRKLNGLPGHPDVKVPNILFNTGSLGMGISKANGWLSADENRKKNSKIIVLIGDGEFQEGQNFESLMYLQNQKHLNPLIIMDNNKIQSDKWVDEVKSFNSLGKKIESFNLDYKEVDGHDPLQLTKVYEEHFTKKNPSPTFVCADTVKSKGIDFAEGSSFDESLELYPHHAGAMKDDMFLEAQEILSKSYLDLANNYELEYIPNFEELQIKNKSKVAHSFNLLEVYKQEVFKFFKENTRNVALDADLLKDAGSIEISRHFPDRFFEFGISEQDLVSFASGISSRGLIPWCHSFSCFLTTRAQEQIFNFCTEKRKGIFIGALAGPIPAAPGHSHQMIRDLALMGSMPNMLVYEPFSRKSLTQFFEFQKKEKSKSFFLRLENCDLSIGNLENVDMPSLGDLIPIIPLKKSTKKVVIIQGAVLLNEIFNNIEDFKNLDDVSIYLAVWLNNINFDFLKSLSNKDIFTFETTTSIGSFSSQLSLGILEKGIKINSLSNVCINQLPECGANDEVLKFHSLDGESILDKVKN